jgi:deazaflavin-dependent oxidoreductase (nitroreductase family)
MTSPTNDSPGAEAACHVTPPNRVPPFVRTFNRLIRIVAGRRVYALLRHRGRRSGKRFETPVVAWKTRSGILVPVVWGTKADWYRNTIASGGCDIQVRGRWYRCRAPRLVERAEVLAHITQPMRTLVRLGPVRQFLLLAEVGEGEDLPAS